MNIWEEAIIREAQYNSRRHFLKKCTSGLGALAMGSLIGCGSKSSPDPATSLLEKKASHFAPSKKCDFPSHGRWSFSFGAI